MMNRLAVLSRQVSKLERFSLIPYFPARHRILPWIAITRLPVTESRQQG